MRRKERALSGEPGRLICHPQALGGLGEDLEMFSKVLFLYLPWV